VQAIIGLGNPGRKYQESRHNIGFLIIDSLLERYKIPLKAGKGDYYFSEIELAGKRTLIIKPTTFMNRSGITVIQMMNNYSIDTRNILVVHDDFHLPFGTLRFRAKGSDGGHNGMESIIYHSGTEVFNRLRFGIGKHFKDVTRFVLSKFTKKEKGKLDDLIQVAVEGVIFWSENGIDETMNKYNKAYI
jgi:PTH1 family peptidyl-tRNA hydrolase